MPVNGSGQPINTTVKEFVDSLSGATPVAGLDLLKTYVQLLLRLPRPRRGAARVQDLHDLRRLRQRARRPLGMQPVRRLQVGYCEKPAK